MSFKFIKIATNQKPVCDFLLVVNNDLSCTSQQKLEK